MGIIRGNHSSFVVSNLIEALIGRLISVEQVSLGNLIGGFRVCSAGHKAFGAGHSRKRLAHVGERGGNRV